MEGSTAVGTQYVYDFSEGSADMRELLGGKGANVAEMTRILGAERVPAGFTITTEACVQYMRDGAEPDGLDAQVDQALARLEERAGKRLGDPDDPLLVSVRSGARESMPGMLDTVLNLGLNNDSVRGLARATGNERFAWDSYRRFVQMFGNVVRGVPGERIEEEIAGLKARRGVELDTDLRVEDLRELVTTFGSLYREQTGEDFPQEPREQLRQAIRAVFDSWNGERAVQYRRLNRIPDEWGTAVNVQQMVFGNKGETSGSGVAFSRDEVTGAAEPSGDFLVNAQGEDVVSGVRNTQELAELARVMPDAHAELLEILRTLERHYGDMQDTEFTIEDGRLYLLQTRSAKRPAQAAVRFAVDAVEEGLLDKAQAVATIDAASLEALLHPTFDPDVDYKVLSKGVAASPGAAKGEIVFRAGDAVAAAEEGREVIDIDLAEGTLRVGDTVLHAGDRIAINGTTGDVTVDEVPLIDPEMTEQFRTVLRWSDDLRRLGVRTNADTPGDARRARDFGAEGIGLCRTEHMFMAADRQPKMRAMIMAGTEEERRAALNKLLPHQQEDFEGLFEAMEGLPVTIRLLDPPLHEFLPHHHEVKQEVERARIEQADDLPELERTLERVSQLAETNPMLGTRGARLGILYPEIFEMQVVAVVRAARAVRERTGQAPHVEIMVPLIDYEQELEFLRGRIVAAAAREGAREGEDFTVGTMIELPRACFVADRIARHADFFSFGTNDLTQTALGFSRDDIEGKILAKYIDRRILDRSPFETIDRPGVGWLVRLAAWVGREARPDLKLGICGEHGGDPDSIQFFSDAGLDYVSCSPYRVPVARVAAAQAAIRAE